MTRTPFNLTVWQDFVMMVIVILVGLGQSAYTAGGWTAFTYAWLAFLCGILLGAGYEARRDDDD